MRVLTVNTGSNSLKLAVFDDSERVVATVVDDWGGDDVASFEAFLAGVGLLAACQMPLQRGCFHARLGEFLRRARCGRETLHSVSIGLGAFADHGQHRRFACAGHAVQADNLFTRKENILYGATLG